MTHVIDFTEARERHRAGALPGWPAAPVLRLPVNPGDRVRLTHLPVPIDGTVLDREIDLVTRAETFRVLAGGATHRVRRADLALITRGLDRRPEDRT